MKYPPFLFRLLAIASLAGTLTTIARVPVAFAEDKPALSKKARDQAKKAFSEGQKAFESGDYEAAYQSFKKANDVAPTPHAQFWMAMSLAGAKKTEEAIPALEALLNDPDAAKLGDEKLGQAKSKLEELRATLVAEVKLASSPAGASVTVDGKAQPGETPMTLKLQPGKHKLEIKAPAHQTEQLELDVKTGDHVDKQVTLTPTPAGPAPMPATPVKKLPPTLPPPPPEKHSMVPAYVCLGGAAIGATVGTIFGIKALKRKASFNRYPTTKKANETELDALIADVGFGFMLTLGVT
ncbi:MAG TPA: PEGA domain-containing protein, partial [Polyangiaceae bacterium]